MSAQGRHNHVMPSKFLMLHVATRIAKNDRARRVSDKVSLFHLQIQT